VYGLHVRFALQSFNNTVCNEQWGSVRQVRRLFHAHGLNTSRVHWLAIILEMNLSNSTGMPRVMRFTIISSSRTRIWCFESHSDTQKSSYFSISFQLFLYIFFSGRTCICECMNPVCESVTSKPNDQPVRTVNRPLKKIAVIYTNDRMNSKNLS
jgi:hypothetical protein